LRLYLILGFYLRVRRPFIKYSVTPPKTTIFEATPTPLDPPEVSSHTLMHLKLRLSAAKSLGVRESDWAILVTGPPANLVFLAKFEHRPAQTSWLEVPLIQIYYVKYLA
jgi:hypothetical protein